VRDEVLQNAFYRSEAAFPVPRAESIDEQFAHLLEYSIINRTRFPVRVLRGLIFSEYQEWMSS